MSVAQLKGGCFNDTALLLWLFVCLFCLFVLFCFDLFVCFVSFQTCFLTICLDKGLDRPSIGPWRRRVRWTP